MSCASMKRSRPTARVNPTSPAKSLSFSFIAFTRRTQARPASGGPRWRVTHFGIPPCVCIAMVFQACLHSHSLTRLLLSCLLTPPTLFFCMCGVKLEWRKNEAALCITHWQYTGCHTYVAPWSMDVWKKGFPLLDTRLEHDSASWVKHPRQHRLSGRSRTRPSSTPCRSRQCWLSPCFERIRICGAPGHGMDDWSFDNLSETTCSWLTRCVFDVKVGISC